tara:strand:+ start:501 stop:695 length:195 start_codon:yes stop_codon:yes gene_type:complete
MNANTNSNETRYVDLTPTWVALLPLLVETANSGESASGRKAAMSELIRLAETVDKMNAQAKQEA